LQFLGGNRTVVESNYFGKGNTTAYDRAIYHPLAFAPQDDFHNYTIDWNKDRLNWIIDGKIVRTLNYGDAVGGQNYPQTPMQVHLGSWAAGDPSEPKGIIEWAQGTTTYDNGPYNMYIKQVYVQDASSGSQYTYGDRTGSYQSIKVEA
jgi:beta-glucanase (GH16 family)